MLDVLILMSVLMKISILALEECMQMDLMEICNMGPMDPGTWEKMVSLEVIQW